MSHVVLQVLKDLVVMGLAGGRLCCRVLGSKGKVGCARNIGSSQLAGSTKGALAVIHFRGRRSRVDVPAPLWRDVARAAASWVRERGHVDGSPSHSGNVSLRGIGASALGSSCISFRIALFQGRLGLLRQVLWLARKALQLEESRYQGNVSKPDIEQESHTQHTM